MLTRFLIVILAVLNVGVALWWMTSRPSEPAVSAKAEPGVATLELLPPSPGKPAPAIAAATAPVAPPEAPPEAPLVAVDMDQKAVAVVAPPEAQPEPSPAAAAVTPPLPEQCSSLGPYADQAKAQAALAALGRDVRRQHLREVPGKPASSYRVLIPPAASREEAQATAKRIVDAGFSDYFIVPQGEEAHAVALGQYRNREGAERRLSTLVAAGFPAKLVTNGSETPASWWLDVASSADPAALKQRASAAQQQSLNCVRLR
ncbi:SPOR domain-containing protein [Stenotrophomonas sp. Iso1]|uniref:SPOR domain-containing protein n=1 Tax=Stenotrophomonas sp. Iso1 TaxID=2977283 RepID=UPI0022B799A7|nr:SPOR domain-containing protein [Stenotrophomonas sp. Iso1]